VKPSVFLPLGLAALLAAASPAAGQPASSKAQIAEAGYTMIRATVVKVDLKTRAVELRDEGGKAFTISVDPALKDLDKVRPGDVVNATLTESVAWEVRKPGKAVPGSTTAASAEGGSAGGKLAGTKRKVTTKTVTVTAIDQKAPSVTFKASDGEVKTVSVKVPSNLVGVKVGDLVEITYTESLVFSVEKAPAK
jgi:hypothetical protein